MQYIGHLKGPHGSCSYIPLLLLQFRFFCILGISLWGSCGNCTSFSHFSSDGTCRDCGLLHGYFWLCHLSAQTHPDIFKRCGLVSAKRSCKFDPVTFWWPCEALIGAVSSYRPINLLTKLVMAFCQIKHWHWWRHHSYFWGLLCGCVLVLNSSESWLKEYNNRDWSGGCMVKTPRGLLE